ncbi:MAG: aminopeptidase N [Proteobacteria bacterium]|nr:aminopeptidase N [Pseudomonadota bacterium]
MREGSATPAAIHRADYRAPAYWIREVELTFDLDAAKTIVASRMRIERNTERAAEPLVLNAEELNLLRVLVDGQSVAFRHENNLLTLDAPAADAFVLEVRNTIAPDKNTALSGLYASGSGLFTQCEAEGFRRITCFADRPDVMATYTVTLRADKQKYPVLLANGNLVEQGDLENGRHYAKWHDPFPKPSYLFALVAADLVTREQWIRTRGGKDHLLQIYVQQGDLEKTEHAMNSLIASLVWDEQRFGLPLDLERFMVVGVSDFNMGAMENKGLNIFNTSALLASPATATDADFARIESIVAHEYFHNWTGNRVTCRDWFQLSLKEGLTVFRDQEFSMDMAGSASARAVCRIENVRDLRAMQFPEDAGSMSHPVRPDSYVEINNFYTATVYDKGAEVVRMYQTLVGRDGFAKGMTLYFERHDGQAVTCDDFAQAMADANPASALATRLDAFKRWYSQAGTPRVTARGVHDAAAQTWTLTLSQHLDAGKLPHVVPVTLGLLAPDGRALPLQLAGEDAPAGTERTLVLDAGEQTFVFTGIADAPVPSLLRGFSAPVVLDDGLADAELLVLLAHDADAFNRWEAGQRLMLARILAAVKSGQPLVLDAALAEALRAVLNHPQLDPAFKALALTVPSEIYVAEQLDVVDPQAIHAAVMALETQLAAALHADWAAAFEANQVVGGYQPTAEQSGRRALANLALARLVRHAQASGDAVWPGRAYQRFKDASQMTDRMGALAALVAAHAPLAEPALAQFHARFQGDALVTDKWFALQARAPEQAGRVFARVKQLVQHPDFTLKNPNRARSLIASLCLFNPGAFHRPDAGGYVFWAEQVLAMDAINPQIAGRLARVMDRWSALAEPYRSAALEALKRVAAKPDLSPDVREIIDRALAAAPATPANPETQA